MENSNSIGRNTGWAPFYIAFKEKNVVVGIIVSFLKNHSQGEYVFDHSWADAYQRSGGNYYPKLQVAVPFTPVSGERILVRPEYDNKVGEMISSAKRLVKENNLSSFHITFCNSDFVSVAKKNNLLVREGIQYHWFNRNDKYFNDVLAYGDENNLEVGAPFIKGAKVEAQLVKNGKNRTVLVFKKRRRQNSRRKNGHRQQYSLIKINKIFNKDGGVFAEASKEKKVEAK